MGLEIHQVDVKTSFMNVEFGGRHLHKPILEVCTREKIACCVQA